MRAAAILGLGCSPKYLRLFQDDKTQCADKVEWQMGLPASAEDANVVLLFGGDGTIHRHLDPLVRLGLPVLVAPAGSGNDFARAIGLPRVRDSLAAWQKFCAGTKNIRTIDLGVISPFKEDAGKVPSTAAQGRSAPHNPVHGSGLGTRYFCCVAGVGLDGEVSRQANQLPRWLRGHGGYALTLLPSIFRFAPLPMKILKPAESVDQELSQCNDRKAAWITASDQLTILAAFANTPFYGGGMKIAPQAKMDDGVLDVCVVGRMNPFKLFCMFPTIYSGQHLNVREVEYFQTTRVRVETEHLLDVYADGEYVCRTPVEIGIQPSVLKIVSS